MIQHIRARVGALLLTLVVGAAPLSAQPRNLDRTDVIPASGDSAVIHADLLQYVVDLSSEQYAGRLTGTPENEAAARYIARELRDYGLRTLEGGNGTGDNGGDLLRYFDYAAGYRTGPDNAVTIAPAKGKKKTLKQGAEVVPMSFSAKGAVAGDLVFAGYGITDTANGYDDYAGIDARGKIAVIMRYSPDGASTHGQFGRFVSFTAKVRNAREHGVAGIIFINPPGDSATMPRMGFDRNFLNAGLPAVFAFSPAFDAVRDPAGRRLAQVQAAIDSTKKSASFPLRGWRVDLATDVEVVNVRVPNVVGVIPGADPKLKDEVIVIGAHFDHLGWGHEGSLHAGEDSAIHHGADDNASGTATLMVLARILGRSAPNRTIVFAAFNGEEEGLLGSKHLVANFPSETGKIVAMINMDMIGRLDSNRLQIHGMGTSPRWDSLVTALNAGRFELKKVKDGFGPSDHSSFYMKDVPVLFFFTGQHKDYHRPSDTWEKVNYGGGVRLVKFIHEVVRAIDAEPTRPPFTKTESSVARGTTGGFRVYVGTIPDYAFEGKGLRLDGVAEGGPAQKAGLKPGDVIVKMAGKEINNIYDYTHLLGELKPGQQVETRLLRNGEPMMVTVAVVGR